MTDGLYTAIETLADEWEADVSRLVALGTNYDDGAAAQSGHCANLLRVALVLHGGRSVTREQVETAFYYVPDEVAREQITQILDSLDITVTDPTEDHCD